MIAMSVGDICTREVMTVREDETVVAAAQRMREQRVGTLVVVEGEEDRIVPIGILTDRDIVVGVVAPSPEHLDRLLVGDVVIHELVTVEEETSVWQALQRMRERGIRRMPVLDQAGYLSGIVTLDDLLMRFVDEMRTISQILQRQGEASRDDA